MDDGNGVGTVGKQIEVVAYEIFAWDSKYNANVTTGTALTWFAISPNEEITRRFAHDSAAEIGSTVGLMAIDGRTAK
jgi:hypothetical protein